MSSRNIYKITFTNISWLHNERKRVIDQIIKYSSHRTIRNCNFLWMRARYHGGRYPLHIYCHVIENLRHLFEDLKLLIEVKRPLRIVLCEENPYDFVNVLGPCFQSLCNHYIFKNLNLPKLLVLVIQRKNHKNTSIFSLLTRI